MSFWLNRIYESLIAFYRVLTWNTKLGDDWNNNDSTDHKPESMSHKYWRGK